MSDDTPTDLPAPPPWVAPLLWQFVVTANATALTAGATPEEALLRTRDAAAAAWPALPATHLREAIAALGGHPTPEAPNDQPVGPTPVPHDRLVECLQFGLLHDERGRARADARDIAARAAAERQAEHLARSRLVVVSLPPDRLHRIG